MKRGDPDPEGQTATSPSGSIGAQLNTISSGAINAGSIAFGMACHLAAAICIGFGLWPLWQSRHFQRSEADDVTKGLAGLVLCGRFTGGGAWVNKVAVTTTDGNATINDTPFHLDGDHANDIVDNVVAACPLCRPAQHLERLRIDEDTALIWPPARTD